jgi:regulator of cell morphogenesis and NO signaling
MRTKDSIIGELVAEDYRSATVFESYGIDFCCKGNRSIEDACEKKKINPDDVLKALDNVLKTTNDENVDYTAWPKDLLVDYIEKKHHRYVEERIPILKQYLAKIAAVHGDNHPELIEVNEQFIASAGELTQHMKKEELILFPHIRKMVKNEMTGGELDAPHFGTVKNPIAMMMSEHENEGDRFEKIVELTNGYVPPSDACSTYTVAFSMLKEFEQDLHRHIHLENNILFPWAVKAEEAMLV